jgi:hypothetical protein
MPFHVAWQMGDGRIRGDVTGQEFTGKREAMRKYEALVQDSLCEWASVVNRTQREAYKLLAKWDYVNGDTVIERTIPYCDDEII